MKQEFICLRYVGGRSIAKLYFNRVRYIFNKENNYTTEVPAKIFWNKNSFAPALIEKETAVDISGDSDVVEVLTETTGSIAGEETGTIIDETICDVCGFKAKSKTGAIAHRRIKHKEA